MPSPTSTAASGTVVSAWLGAAVAALLLSACRNRNGGVSPLPVSASAQAPTTTAVLASPSPTVTPSRGIQIYRAGGDISEPVEISRVLPTVPPAVQRSAGSAGILLFEATITAEGTVTNVRSLRPVPAAARELERLYAEALARWRYRPAIYKGRPVRVYLTISFTTHYR